MNPPPATAEAATTTVVGSFSPVIAQFHTDDQIETQTQPQLAQSQPHLPPEIQDSVASDMATSSSVTAATTTTDMPDSPPQNPSPSTKLAPLRPRKIRKLSPDTTTAVADSDSGVSDSVASVAGDATPTTTASMAIVPVNGGKPKSAASSKTAQSKMIVAGAGRPPLPRMVARSLSYPGEIEMALQHLQIADPHLAQLIALHQTPTFDSFQSPFLALTKNILYQQLAYKAGTSIYSRFVALCGGEGGVLPDAVLALTAQQLRQIGVSGRKASYLHDLARKYKSGILSDESLITMDDKSLFTILTMVNGIGSWSVHMFMIFSLHRPDVLPVNDLGVRKGVQLLYGLEVLPRPSQMEHLCDKWRPYRSVASWYLWRLVEAKGTPSSAAAGMSLELQEQQLHPHQLQLHHLQQRQQQQSPQPPTHDPMNGIMNLGFLEGEDASLVFRLD